MAQNCADRPLGYRDAADHGAVAVRTHDTLPAAGLPACCRQAADCTELSALSVCTLVLYCACNDQLPLQAGTCLSAVRAAHRSMLAHTCLALSVSFRPVCWRGCLYDAGKPAVLLKQYNSTTNAQSLPAPKVAAVPLCFLAAGPQGALQALPTSQAQSRVLYNDTFLTRLMAVQ